MVKKGYTFVEVLIVLILISIFFSILVIMTDSTLRAYATTRQILQTLYAQSYVDFLFDVLEGELKWAGSGSNLLKGEQGDSGLRKPDRTKYTEIVDVASGKPWLYDSIDIEKTATGFIIYITYIIASPVKLYYNGTTGICRPLSEGYLDSPSWSIVTRAIAPSSEHYIPTLVKLKYYYLDSGVYKPVTGILRVTPDMRFQIKEIDLSTSVEKNLVPSNFPSNDPTTAPDELFVTPISKFKNVVFNTGYATRTFRQIRIEYNSQTKEINMVRFIPSTDLSQNTYSVKLLDNVESFQGSLVYYFSGEFKELRFDDRDDWNTYKNSAEVKNIKDSIVGMKFTVTWKPSWNLSNSEKITKTRLIIIPQGMQ